MLRSLAHAVIDDGTEDEDGGLGRTGSNDNEPGAKGRGDPERPIRILVVEDEAIIALDVERLLVEFGYDVCGTAASAASALAEAERTKPDLVLMDIHLEGPVDGIEAARELRERFGIGVVYLTAHTDAATVIRAQKTFPYGFVTKPYSRAQLEATLRHVVNRLRSDGDDTPPGQTS